MLNSGRKDSKPISKFAIFLGVAAGFMTSFSVARNEVPSGPFNNLADAIMWGGVFLAIIFICKHSLRRFKFFNVVYGSIDTKSALVGAFVCTFVYLIMIFLTTNL
ncbi:MAG: hypothetical protein AAB824_01995 [Patescibacteria group bacterium]